MFNLFEPFLVSAITTILLVRFYLQLTGYPQVGGETLQIAHVLWGGLLLTLSLLFVLTFITSKARYVGALMGGIGFGLFIDELGKFITRDNNYFFQPTIAIIYIIFVILFLLMQTISRIEKISRREYLINAIELIKDVALEDFDKYERKSALNYLHQSDATNPIVIQLKNLLKTIPLSAADDPSIFIKVKTYTASTYREFITKRWFETIIIVFFGLQAVAALAMAGFIGLASLSSIETFFQITISPLSVAEKGQLIATSVAAIYVVLGIIMLHRSRIKAFYFFKWALLISIFFTQVFMFYQEQFLALTSLFSNILLLIGIDYMINQEVQLRKVTDTED